MPSQIELIFHEGMKRMINFALLIKNKIRVELRHINIEKQAVYISLIISAISLTSAIMFRSIYKETPDLRFVSDVLVGIFTGGIVSLLYSTGSYFVCKRDASEEFYFSSLSYLLKFKHLEYLDLQEPVDLIASYLGEQVANEMYKNMNEQLIEHGVNCELYRLNYDQRKLALKEIRSKYILPKEMHPYQFGSIVNERFDLRILGYKRDLVKVMTRYIEISKLSYKPVDCAWNRIRSFLKTKQRNEMYENIYYKQREALNEVLMASRKFESHIGGEHVNISEMLRLVVELQNKFFSVETSEDEAGITTRFYNKYAFDMECTFEGFRAKLYRDEKEEPDKSVLGSWHNKNII